MLSTIDCVKNRTASNLQGDQAVFKA